MGEPDDRARGRQGADVLAGYACPAVLAGLVLAAGATALTVRTLDFPTSSRGHPLVVVGGAAVLLASIAVRNRESRAAQSLAPARLGTRPAFELRVGAFLVIWLLYPVMLMALGFLGSTVAALSASLCLLGIERRWAWVAGSVPVTLVVFGLLQVLLNIALPQGAVDRLVADFLYGLQG